MLGLYRTQFRRLTSNEGCDMLWFQRCKIEMSPRILLHQKTVHEQQHIALQRRACSQVTARSAACVVKCHLI